MRTYKLVLGYDGSNFAGSQRQGERRTVQLELENAWHSATGQSTSMRLAGRTDAGVHAEGQVAGVRGPADLDEATLKTAMNETLPPDVWVRSVSAEADGFDARHDARRRKYRYTLPDDARLFGGDWVDVRRVEEAAAGLIGERDFTALSSVADLGPRGAVRRILAAGCERTAMGLEFTFVADAFLRQMVRRLVSSLVAVGTGRMGAWELNQATEMKLRSVLPAPAPAEYLTLVEVGYGEFK